jgi:hypothetical protein
MRAPTSDPEIDPSSLARPVWHISLFDSNNKIKIEALEFSFLHKNKMLVLL